jgi:hypothetical protein
MLFKSAVSRAVKTLLVAMTIPLLAGCVAEQRLAWSPDGKKMALVGADGVRVSTDGGLHLGEPVEEDAQLVAWFPDSKRVAVVTKSECENWSEFEKTVDKEEVDAIKNGAAQLLKQLESCQGDYAACRDALMKERFNGAYIGPILYYLRSTAQSDMSRLVGHEWNVVKPSDSFTTISWIKIFDVEGNGALRHKQTLTCTADDFESVKVSPSNEFVCLVDRDANLCLSQTAPGSKGFRRIASKFAKLPDWDVNTDVIYGLHDFAKVGKADQQLKELVSVDVRKPVVLKRLTTTSTPNHKVRATVDGNLILGSVVNIPAGKRGKARSIDALNVFNLTSGKTKRIYQALKGDKLENFEVSPDGKNLSIPNVNGAVKVVSLQSGKTRQIVAGNPKNERDVFTPVWRNNNEVCFERVPVKDDIGQVALFSLNTNKSRDISVKWPPKAVFGLLNKPDDKQLTFEQMLRDLKEQKKTKV